MLAGGELPLLAGKLLHVLVHIVDVDGGRGNGLLIGEGDVSGVCAKLVDRDREIPLAGEGVALRHLGGVRGHRVGARVQGALLGVKLLPQLVHIVDGDGGRADLRGGGIGLLGGEADVQEEGGQGLAFLAKGLHLQGLAAQLAPRVHIEQLV